MTVRITEECIECGACLAICPADAIEETPDDGFAIKQDLCNQCGVCIPECPMEAIAQSQ